MTWKPGNRNYGQHSVRKIRMDRIWGFSLFTPRTALHAFIRRHTDRGSVSMTVAGPSPRLFSILFSGSASALGDASSGLQMLANREEGGWYASWRGRCITWRKVCGECGASYLIISLS